MRQLKRGMVVDVDLDPTKGSEMAKRRPCLVITNDTYNARSPIIQVIPITMWSEKKARIYTNVELSPTKDNGLSKRSILNCHQTRPIDKHYRVGKIRGNVSQTVIENVDKALKSVFALK